MEYGRRCAKCGAQIPNNSKFCLNCGQQLGKEKKPTVLITLIVCATIALLALIIGLCALRIASEPDKPVEKITEETVEIEEETEPEEIIEQEEASEPEEAVEVIVEPEVTYAVGDYIELGRYEQDNLSVNGEEPIQWQILEIVDGKALVLSRYAIESKPYHSIEAEVSWEVCTLRNWLNGDFLFRAFTDQERAKILNVTVPADKNPKYYSTGVGNETRDSVFLLSVVEAERYLTTDEARQCVPTEFAKARWVYVDDDNGNCCWWLRSPGDNRQSAARVYSRGTIDMDGDYVHHDFDAVRPAMWIDLNG